MGGGGHEGLNGYRIRVFSSKDKLLNKAFVRTHKNIKKQRKNLLKIGVNQEKITQKNTNRKKKK